ncbi:MAG: hydrogenase maturation nickel metallochaperone HypA [Candidatus Methanomethylophilaceae archaeon]|nr:hydrogenase maturation nickel metallochaperone HypA [Candidatus Cloacimonadota bacterium]MCK9322717.1 hydrogenase maturation nickel metallochaperone HypA [Candidatus Methanomethylophilaceae archaeon]MDD3379576.1 hydrogenase maturation nickel metallochaperone HypA [Candidatus Methanomethylophilaceae archaeon]MDY0225123.1 hydrogenase maturation nickel metallochaperone HypA [Candidatus Methanomethylophilaceae archaeon]
MHEVSVVSDLVSAIINELKKYNVVSVEAVTITVGKLTNLGSEQMEFAYEIMTRDTILEGSKLNIEEEDIKLKCDACGYEGPAKNLDFGDSTEHFIPVLACPKCGGHVKIIAGQTCCVKNMNIEEAN